MIRQQWVAVPCEKLEEVKGIASTYDVIGEFENFYLLSPPLLFREYMSFLFLNNILSCSFRY
jgi:hypothetical protein